MRAHVGLPRCATALSNAIKAFKVSDYPQALSLEYDIVAFDIHYVIHQSPGMRKAVARAYESLPAYITWASKVPNCQRACFHKILLATRMSTAAGYMANLNVCESCIKDYVARKDHDPWIAAMLQGVWHRETGWARRGDGWASQAAATN